VVLDDDLVVSGRRRGADAVGRGRGRGPARTRARDYQTAQRPDKQPLGAFAE
jgi:hypothetical protein